MTHEQFIELSTAKLAKQVGFDWECLGRYSQEGTLEIQGDFDFELLALNWNNLRSKDYNKMGIASAKNSISAPTQSVLQRWLREVKKIYLHIAYDAFENGWYTYIPDTDYYSETFTTYEAAFEVGLQKCLTLLLRNNVS